MRFTGSAKFTPGNTSGLVSRLTAAAQGTTKRTADMVLQQSQVLVPIDTGALYNSGNVTEENSGALAQSCVNYDKEYAGYVEFGTYKMEAQPYLRPALDAAHDLLTDNAVEDLKAAL